MVVHGWSRAMSLHRNSGQLALRSLAHVEESFLQLCPRRNQVKEETCVCGMKGGTPPPCSILSQIYGNMSPVTQMSSRSPLAFCRARISWCRMQTHCKLDFRGGIVLFHWLQTLLRVEQRKSSLALANYLPFVCFQQPNFVLICSLAIPLFLKPNKHPAWSTGMQPN